MMPSRPVNTPIVTCARVRLSSMMIMSWHATRGSEGRGGDSIIGDVKEMRESPERTRTPVCVLIHLSTFSI